MSSGLQYLLPRSMPWAVMMADYLHRHYQILPSKIYQTAKNTADPQYRSSEHGITIEISGSIGDTVELLPEINLSPYIFEQFENRQVADTYLIREAIGLLGQLKNPGRDHEGNLIDGDDDSKKFMITIKQESSPTDIPMGELTRYIAGLGELIHTHTTPEVMLTENSQTITQHRLSNSTAIILKALYNIARHNGPLVLNTM